jgi:hypothetical protein
MNNKSKTDEWFFQQDIKKSIASLEAWKADFIPIVEKRQSYVESRVRPNQFVFTTSPTCFLSPRRGHAGVKFLFGERLSGQSRRSIFQKRGERFSLSWRRGPG